MVNKKLIILSLIIIVISLATFGCIESTLPKEESNNRMEIIYNQHLDVNSSFINNVNIIHDNINDVTCYSYSVGNGVGLSCITDSEINYNKIKQSN